MADEWWVGGVHRDRNRDLLMYNTLNLRSSEASPATLPQTCKYRSLGTYICRGSMANTSTKDLLGKLSGGTSVCAGVRPCQRPKR